MVLLGPKQMFRRIAHAEGDYEEAEILLQERGRRYRWFCSMCNTWHGFDQGESFFDMMGGDGSTDTWLCYQCWERVLAHAREQVESNSPETKRRRL